MLGYKVRDFRPLKEVSLEDLVPEDNFYRQVERSIDLSFVCDLANVYYSNMGRPSIDPIDQATSPYAFSFLKFTSQRFISPLLLTFSTVWSILRCTLTISFV